MRFSVCVDTGRPWAELRRVGELADAQDWHALYVSDHFLPVAPPGSPVDDPVLEAWTVLSALGALTSRVRLGSLVLGNSYRHPAVVANMAAALDQVTGGRVVLGLGAGWQENEHAAYGIAFPDLSERMDRFEESCRVITSLLRERRASFDGTYYRLADATVRPPPVSPRLPVLIGGAGERRTLRIAARYADIWHAWASPSEFERKTAVLDRHCREVGRDPAGIERATGQVVELRSSTRDSAEVGGVVGTADQVADALARYVRSGVTEFIVRDHRDTDVETALETMSTLTTDVFAQLR
jgi:F420-dependent oxidoreductase-like protein